jgi:hypothetical protein
MEVGSVIIYAAIPSVLAGLLVYWRGKPTRTAVGVAALVFVLVLAVLLFLYGGMFGYTTGTEFTP